jgi:hypothetical protein
VLCRSGLKVRQGVYRINRTDKPTAKPPNLPEEKGGLSVNHPPFYKKPFKELTTGKKTDMYGPNPQGQRMYDPTGRFTEVITRSDLPKFASNNRQAGTPEENKAIVQGSMAFFGTYSVSETDKTYTQHVESCTFPNWNGAERKYSFDISGDELNVTVISAPSTGMGTAHSVWKRAK